MSKTWRKVIQSLYPDLLTSTYCVPPVHFHRVPYSTASVAGQPALVLNQLQEGSTNPQTSQPGAATAHSPSTVCTTACTSACTTACTACTSACTTACTSTSTVPSLHTTPSMSTPATTQVTSPVADKGGRSSRANQSGATKQPVSSHPSLTIPCQKSPAPAVTAACQQTAGPAYGATSQQSITTAQGATSQQSVTTAQGATSQQSVTTAQGATSQQSVTTAQGSTSQQTVDFMSLLNQALASTVPYPQSDYSLWPKIPQQLKPTRVQESDARDDFAQHHVLANLQELAHHNREVMFILSQLNFGDYLNKPSYAAAAAQLPKPADLGKTYSRGEFDVLVIHRRYGILVGELKSVGRSAEHTKKPEAEQDADVAKRVQKAVKQLEKSEKVVKHVVRDIVSTVKVRKTLILPYVSSTQLARTLANNPQLEKAVCQCLDASNAVEATQLCICMEQLSDVSTYWDVTPEVLSNLTSWWQRRMACTPDPSMDDRKYVEIIARLVGPASSVHVHCPVSARLEVRTLGQAVSELGDRLSCLVLTPQQLDLLTRQPPWVFLTGPPGTGKTVMLVLMSLQWLLQGQDVHILSIVRATQAAALLIHHQLSMTLKAMGERPAVNGVGSLYLQLYDCRENPFDIPRIVTFLIANIFYTKTALVFDEAHYELREDSGFLGSNDLSFQVLSIVDAIMRYLTATNMCCWVASICSFKAVLPVRMQEERLTIPLRSAPVIVREMQTNLNKLSWVLPFDFHVKYSGDGLKVIHLCHQGDDHQGHWPLNCLQCGLDILDVMRQLHVEVPVPKLANSPSPLRYKDVFILTDGNLEADTMDAAGQVTSSPHRMVQGLRSRHIPVRVLETDPADQARWDKDLADTVVAGSNCVTVANFESVLGLERKIVAFLPSVGFKPTHFLASEERKEATRNGFGKMLCISRCTVQLVLVDMPLFQELSLD